MPEEHSDYRDLLTALKLLSGHECLRDASQAQRILVGLTESPLKDVAADAKAIMKSGLKNGWFDRVTPQYLSLKLLAEQSLINYKKGSRDIRQKITLVIGGVAFIVAGLVVFFFANRDLANASMNAYVVAGLVFAFLLALVWYKSQRIQHIDHDV